MPLLSFLHPSKKDAENNAKTERGLPAYSRHPVKNQVPEKIHDGTDRKCESKKYDEVKEYFLDFHCPSFSFGSTWLLLALSTKRRPESGSFHRFALYLVRKRISRNEARVNAN
jgi:hypothetical protein